MLLIIDNYDSFTFNLNAALQMLKAETHVVKNDQITLKQVSQLKPSGIVLSPGPGRPEKAGICVELIRKFSGKLPILGVCLGHQAIVYAYGGQIVHASHIYHGKTSLIFHRRKNLFQNMPLPFVAGRYHSLMADKANLPDVFSVEAETVDGTVMAIAHNDYPVFGTQFHPESILTPEGSLFLQQFIRIC